ncbi:beta-ketoacyl-[acyl-carrier-protein] synthase family protein [Phytohabitans suffuscus]|uniref:Beta-ketoacyl-[acyl-carrier-protein] synthase III N-terminal domain-containing protein n=1 Tax=Phytohabitans suffuscus TaxID=624315 RepID=A0A6F8YCI8_9ACTN|nr:hypothetical protein [Phytohabitans suffuscus]BCB83777.1 hypothetical protein Psuf_010900 [Phytohabitans suffuscus]
MTPPPLALLGLGFDLPPPVDVVALAAAKGVDTSGYRSWPRACHVRGPDDQPSTMGATALRQALDESGVSAADLRLLIFTGVSRDYPPSWSVATEIMHLVRAGADCLGLDLTLGCAASLSALDLAQGWLAARGGGVAAVVAAERWSHTVDPTNPASRTWAWADGAAAVVTGVGAAPGFAAFLGAEFTTRADYNGHVLVRYGGTRHPVAPPGVDVATRLVSDRPRDEIRATYLAGYTAAYAALTDRLRVHANRLVCNQISPAVVALIAEGLGVPSSRTVLTGPELGHLGAADIFVGLDRLRGAGLLDEPVIMGSSTAYAFGTGIVGPAEHAPALIR